MPKRVYFADMRISDAFSRFLLLSDDITGPIMRIQLTLEPSLFAKPVAAGPSSGPLAQLGGEIVLIELQGELNWEGEKAGGVVGVIGLDRPDKPTLHLGPHHLLHGKFANLPKPLAIIRRGTNNAANTSINGAGGHAVQGDVDEEVEEEEEEEDEQDDEEDVPGAGRTGSTSKSGTRISATGSAASGAKKRKANLVDHSSDEEDDSPLFPENDASRANTAAAGPSTPTRSHNRFTSDHITPASSSPFLPPSSMKDFSSELDYSSPPPSSPPSSSQLQDDGEDDDEAEGTEGEGGQKQENRAQAKKENERERVKRQKLELKRAERRAQRPERTRIYEVVGLVRRKVVFALRTYRDCYNPAGLSVSRIYCQCIIVFVIMVL